MVKVAFQMAKYLQIPPWAHFWDLDGQLRRCFNQITGESSYKLYKRFVLLFQALSLILFSVLISLPLTPFQRHLLSDPSLFFGLAPTLNWIFLIFGADNLAFHLRIYQPATEVLWHIRELLFGKTGTRKVRQINVKPGIWRRNGKGQSSIELVSKYVGTFFLMAQYFIYFEVALLLFYKISSLYLIALDWRFFLTTIPGYASLLLILVSSLFIDIFVLTYTNSHFIAGAVFIALTFLTYFQFEKANLLLQKRPLTSLNLRRFISLHTRMLALIFQFNAYHGQLLAAFIAINLPCNSYLLLRLLLGHFNGSAAIIFLNFICMQFLAIFIFHALGASFSSRIHAFTRRLFAHQRANLSLANKIKVDCYLMKFNVPKKYGITYGSIGLMTFASFSKFLLVYSEIIMYWFQLVPKK